jgi:hypothetical protein
MSPKNVGLILAVFPMTSVRAWVCKFMDPAMHTHRVGLHGSKPHSVTGCHRAHMGSQFHPFPPVPTWTIDDLTM